MEYQHWTIKYAMEQIGAKKLYLPAIQRKFVWDSTQIEKLFDSIMRDYPIGTFLFWMVEEAKHNDYAFYEFIRDFHTRDNWKNPLAAKPHLPDDLIGVLDGQQRLNSMYVALQGSYTYKLPRLWATNPAAYPKREFYLNVFRPEAAVDGDDYVYEFSFLAADEARETNTTACWCLVKDVLNCKGLHDVAKLWKKRQAAIPKETDVSEDLSERAESILLRLYERLTTIPIINYFPVKNQNLDEVLDIFVRVNSAGTPLAKTDLLFSTIVAHWEEGRAAIEELLQALNSKGSGFFFDTDFAMRACLVLADCSVRLRVASFKAENVQRIINSWEVISHALHKAVDLLVEWGFDGATLTSMNAVIPVAYAVKARFDIKSSKADLRLLLIKSLATGIYGGSSDQVLTNFRNAMDATAKTGRSFKLLEFEKTVRLPGGASLRVTDDMLDEMLLSTLGARSFLVLSLLSPQLKFGQVEFHQDHIHPRARFGVADLRKLNLTDDEINEWIAMRDALPNLQLLEGKENKAKQAKPFAEWLKKEYPKAAEERAFRRTHFIPDDVSMEFADFRAFFEARRLLLREKLAALLGGVS